MSFTVTANGDVVGGTARAIRAEWARLEPLTQKRRRVGDRARPICLQDERDFFTCCEPVARGGLRHVGSPPRSTVYNIFRKFRREEAWEAVWAGEPAKGSPPGPSPGWRSDDGVPILAVMRLCSGRQLKTLMAAFDPPNQCLGSSRSSAGLCRQGFRLSVYFTPCRYDARAL
jgi:hypothetical protein